MSEAEPGDRSNESSSGEHPVETSGRRRGRSRSRRTEAPQGIQQVPFTRLKRPFEATKVVGEDQLEAIHEASLVVLENVGMDVLEPAARTIFADAGCRVDGERVRFDPEMVTEAIAHAPREFTLHARNPAHDVQIGGDNVVFLSLIHI